MRLHRNQPNSPGKISSRPYDELFIYYLKGRLKPNRQIFKRNFIGNWEEEDDSILFFSSSADRQIEKLIHQQPQLECVDRYHMTYDQWLGEKVKAFSHGAFHILPPWAVSERRTNSPVGKLRIILDPGLVFGTGTHPTTRNCLEALELAAGTQQISSVLDLASDENLEEAVALQEAIDRLEGEDPRAALVTRLRFYAGLTVEETARAMELSERTVMREWAYARAWLHDALSPPETPPAPSPDRRSSNER